MSIYHNIEDFACSLESEVKPNGSRGRSGAYYRHHRYRSINRKVQIVKETGRWVIREDRKGRVGKGYLHKGKIHCGCGMCVSKTAVWGWKISDQRKLDACNYSVKEG